MMYRRFGKRTVDLFVSVLGVIFLSVPMIVIAIAIKCNSKGPAIFKQVRLGKNQKEFTVYKFRTMCDNAYNMGGIATRSNDARITKVGAFLRRTSLDEIPQLFNIIKGDMSIIGPRPILKWEFDEYKENPIYCKRYTVLPGMFCTVDIDYRADADRDLQFTMDAEYTNQMSFGFDLKCFFGVIKTVLTGKNVYKEEVKEDSVKEDIEAKDKREDFTYER